MTSNNEKKSPHEKRFTKRLDTKQLNTDITNAQGRVVNMNDTMKKDINYYHASSERKALLDNRKDTLVREINELEYNKQIILDNIDRSKGLYSNVNNYMNDTDNLIENGNQFIPQNKVVKIKTETTESKIINLTFYHYHGDTTSIPISSSSNTTNETDIITNEYLIKHNDYIIGVYVLVNEILLQIEIIIFYTKNEQNILINPRNLTDDEINNETRTVKEYTLDPTPRTWEGHKRHIIDERTDGYQLASITTSEEYEKAMSLLRGENKDENGNMNEYQWAWIGGVSTHKEDSNASLPTKKFNGNSSRSSNNWKWIDGSQWNDVLTTFNSSTDDYYHWRKDQPNNAENEEYYLVLRNVTDTNDINGSGFTDRRDDNNPYVAILSRTITQQLKPYTYYAGTDEHLVFLSNTTISINNQFTNSSIDVIENAEDFKNIIIEYAEAIEIRDDVIPSVRKIKKMIQIKEEEIIIIEEEINKIDTFNSNMKITSGFENFENIKSQNNNNIFSNISNYIYNIIIKAMGFKEGLDGNDDDVEDYVKELADNIITADLIEINELNNFREEQYRNYLLELATQQNSVFSNIAIDYLSSDNKNSISEKAIENLNQKNNDLVRNIELNLYKLNTINKYSNSIKIVIILIVSMIIVAFLNTKNILGKNLTLAIIIAIIIIIIAYVLYVMHFIYSRDKFNFTKTNIPFDNEQKEMIIKKNENEYEKPESSYKLDLGCVGEDCCDTNTMRWDLSKNRCYLLNN